MKNIISIPHKAKELIEALEKNGFCAYAVGGCVRDSILGRKPNDWDICTSAEPHETLRVFSDRRVIETGLKHGTVTVLCDGEPYEITTFRIDGTYTDSRRPDFVNFTKSLADDLVRRDFTINAMAYNDRDGLVDLYGGKEDLENKIIRCVGDAKRRFEEDALRILRAIRFACQLDFEIEESTSLEIHRGKDSLKNISAERIQTELCKMVCCEIFPDMLVNFRDVFAVFIPNLSAMFDFKQNNPWHVHDVFIHTVTALKSCKSDELCVKLAVLFHDIGKPFCYSEDEKGIGHFYGHAEKSAELCDGILKGLKFDNETRNTVTELVKLHDVPVEADKKIIKRRLSKIGEKQLRRLLIMKEADNLGQNTALTAERIPMLYEIRDMLDEIMSENECFSVKDLAVSGKDLLEIGYKSDKNLGKTLNRLLEEVIAEKVRNDRDELLDFARKML